MIDRSRQSASALARTGSANARNAINEDLLHDEDYDLNEIIREEVRSNNSLISDKNEKYGGRCAKPSPLSQALHGTIEVRNRDQNDLQMNKLNQNLGTAPASRDDLRKYATSRSTQATRRQECPAFMPTLRDHQHQDEIYNSLPQARTSQPPSYHLSLDMQRLDELMNDKQEWINIQPSIKLSMGYLQNVSV